MTDEELQRTANEIAAAHDVASDRVWRTVRTIISHKHFTAEEKITALQQHAQAAEQRHSNQSGFSDVTRDALILARNVTCLDCARGLKLVPQGGGWGGFVHVDDQGNSPTPCWALNICELINGGCQ